jgi:hypothetical protein
MNAHSAIAAENEILISPISAITGLATAAAGMKKAPEVELPAEIAPKECTPTALLYPIVSGVVENKPISFPVNQIK